MRMLSGLRYGSAPPRMLNEFPHPGNCGSDCPHSKAVEGVRPIGLLLAIVLVQCQLRRIEAKVCEASNGECFFWATHVRGVERGVWEQAAWSEWVADGHAAAAILNDLLKAFDHVAYQKLVAAAVARRFPLRHLRLMIQLYQAARHVELHGVAGERLHARRG